MAWPTARMRTGRWPLGPPLTKSLYERAAFTTCFRDLRATTSSSTLNFLHEVTASCVSSRPSFPWNDAISLRVTLSRFHGQIMTCNASFSRHAGSVGSACMVNRGLIRTNGNYCLTGHYCLAFRKTMANIIWPNLSRCLCRWNIVPSMQKR